MEILSYAGNVATQVAIMLLMVLTGFAAARFKWIDKNGVPQLINLLFYVVTPLVIINSFLSVEYSHDRLLSLLIMAGCAIFVHMVGLLIGWIFYRREEHSIGAVLRCTVAFSNCGFMSLPLAQALFGDVGVFFVSIYVVVHNVIIWTVGVRLFDRSAVSFKKAFFNPGTIGVLVGLPLFLLNIPLPQIITSPIASLSSMNTPLAMIVMGFYLSRTAARIQKGDGKLLGCMLLRLLAVPAVSLAALSLLPIPSEVFLACMLPASAPPASNTMMFASKFGADADSASRMATVATVLSIITIPLFMTLAQLVK